MLIAGKGIFYGFIVVGVILTIIIKNKTYGLSCIIVGLTGTTAMCYGKNKFMNMFEPLTVGQL